MCPLEMLEGVLLLGGHGGRTGAVEVDVLPLAVTAVPDARLLGLGGAW